MSNVLLDQWSAVEIFCRVVCRCTQESTPEDFLDKKFDALPKTELAALQNNKTLWKELERYSEVKVCEYVSAKVFGLMKGTKNTRRPKSFYELGRKIRHQIPVVLESTELSDYLSYAHMTDEQIKQQSLDSKWVPSNKQRGFEGSTWILYYFHRGNKKDSPEGRGEVGSVARAVLHFRPFGKAEIIGFDKNENYEGTFQMYGAETFISFVMKLKDKNERDLRGMIYVGTGEVDLALGQFHNAHKGINSGTILMERVTAKNAKHATAGYFDAQGIKSLPDYVQKYFSGKQNNMLRVPTCIQSLPEFEKWHAGKNRK